MTTINPDDKEFSPNPQEYKTAKHIIINTISDTSNYNYIKGYSYSWNEAQKVKKYMLLNKSAAKLLADETLEIKEVANGNGEFSLPDEFGKPGVPAALICRNDIAQGKYVENIDGVQHYTFGQYVTYNKNKSFVCAEGKRYYKFFEDDGVPILIIVADYKQGLPTEVSAYAYESMLNGKRTITRIFHQLYDDYGYPKTLTTKYDTLYDHDFYDKTIQSEVVESWNFDKTKFFGVYSKYVGSKLLEWRMLDGKNSEDIDGLLINRNISDNTIKVSYYITSKEVTPQQYIDHIKSISFKGILGDSKHPEVASLIMQYSALSHIKGDLIEAKKVLIPYNTQTNIIEALQVIDTVVKLLP